LNVELTHHAAEILEAVRAQTEEPVELILEHALENFAREQRVERSDDATVGVYRQGVREMLDFVKQNRVRLDPGISVKDLIREGQRL